MPSAAFAIASIDTALPQRLLGLAAQPGMRCEIHGAGLVLFAGTSAEPGNPLNEHRFVVEFGSANAAAVLANWLWSSLHGHVATLRVGDDDVPIQNGAIKQALLAAAK
jgi:hypothetical protein